MIEVELPDGSIAEFPDGTSDDTIKGVLQREFGGQQQATPLDQEKAKRDQYYSSGIYAGAYNPLGAIARTLEAGASGAQRAPLFGWDDEAQAAIATRFGTSGDYEQARQKFDAQKQARREQNPIASGVGELGGAIVTAASIGTRMNRPQANTPFSPYAAGPGLTLAGRSLPYIGRTGAAALEGAGYGAVTGAGEAQPGERMQGAAYGGAVGAATGAIASKAGDMLASRAARSVAQQTAPTIDDLASASNALYTQANQAGVTIKPQSSDRLLRNMALVAGKPNPNLRPRTLGVMQDVLDMRGKPMTLQDFDELRQSIGLAMKNADPQDVRTLQLMKNVVDGFADRVSPGDITGNVDGFQYLKDARALWAKKSKTELIEQMMDLSDVQSATYSQSGMQNAIKQKAKQLYGQIAKGKVKGFTAEETALVRKLSKGEMTPKVIEWLGKFAPRGVVSAGGGAGVGALMGSALGPAGSAIGAAVPGVIGFGAANMADRAALQGVQALRNAAATGQAPVLNAITNKTVPLIGPLSGMASNQLVQSR